jgi:hypothetical protein
MLYMAVGGGGGDKKEKHTMKHYKHVYCVNLQELFPIWIPACSEKALFVPSDL